MPLALDGHIAIVTGNSAGLGKSIGFASAVLYRASEEASFVTGQTLCVNGGLTPW